MHQLRIRPCRRIAFTLIELLVVIAIIAILIGLLLPAVQKVREAAARMSCSNNLKQMGIALHMYHDSNQTFPWGGSDDYSDSSGNEYMSLPWGVYILPYLEQGNLYKMFTVAMLGGGVNSNPTFNGQSPGALGPSSPFLFNNPPNNTNTTTGNPAAVPLKVYRCPSSPSPDGAVYQDTWTGLGCSNIGGPPAGATSWTVAVTDYVPASGVPGGGSPYISIKGPSEGILNDNYAVTIPMISDGTSNTWLVGESGGAPNVYIAGPKLFAGYPYQNLTALCTNYNVPMVASGLGWADENNGDWWISGNDPTGMYSNTTLGPCVINCSNIGNGFFAFHASGANFLYADGHVQFVQQSIAPNIAYMLVLFADGLPIPSY